MIKKLGLQLEWHETFGGTKKGLAMLAHAVQLISKKQDELINKVNELEKSKESKNG